MRKHQVDSKFVANNSHRGSIVREERSESLVEYSVFPSANSESGSFSVIRNGTNPDSPISISSIFPAYHSDSENDGSSESNETSPRFYHNSNSIMSFFPPARSATYSPKNYEITTSFCISSIFPPDISETETNDSCSESNQLPRAQFSCSIMSLFPPAGSQTDSSSSKNYEIIIGQILPTPNLRIFNFTELKVATRNFRLDIVLGGGGFGQVFKGWLKYTGQSKSGNGMVIVVKKLNSESLQEFQDLQSEVSFIGRFSHPNLIKLLGYCWEDRMLLLVYEFMQKGSLADHLLRRSTIQPLPWDIRLKIAIGVARGLTFLHTCDEQIIDGDFKASNILLDESYTAKISAKWTGGPSDGESLLTEPSCYYAPWYVNRGHLYIKSDVYSFGVVLVEILTGLRALDTTRPIGKHNLVGWIKPYLSGIRKLKQIMDSWLGEKYPSKAAFHISQLAQKCLAAEPKHRPSMKEVLEKLEWFEAANERPRESRNHASHPMVHRQGQQPLHHRSPLHPRLDGNPAYQNSSRVR